MLGRRIAETSPPRESSPRAARRTETSRGALTRFDEVAAFVDGDHVRSPVRVSEVHAFSDHLGKDAQRLVALRKAGIDAATEVAIKVVHDVLPLRDHKLISTLLEEIVTSVARAATASPMSPVEVNTWAAAKTWVAASTPSASWEIRASEVQHLPVGLKPQVSERPVRPTSAVEPPHGTPVAEIRWNWRTAAVVAVITTATIAVAWVYTSGSREEPGANSETPDVDRKSLCAMGMSMPGCRDKAPTPDLGPPTFLKREPYERESPLLELPAYERLLSKRAPAFKE